MIGVARCSAIRSVSSVFPTPVGPTITMSFFSIKIVADVCNVMVWIFIKDVGVSKQIIIVF